MAGDRPTAVNLVSLLEIAIAIAQVVLFALLYTVPTVTQFVSSVFPQLDVGLVSILLIGTGILSLLIGYYVRGGDAFGWLITMILLTIDIAVRILIVTTLGYPWLLFSTLLAFDAIILILIISSSITPYFGGENIRMLLRKVRIEMQPRTKELRFTLRLVRKSPLSIVGASIVIFYALMALLAPILAVPGDISQGGNPEMMPREGISLIPKSPNAAHPFGTMEQQYDIYYGCIWGSRAALRIGIYVAGGSLLIGLSIGIIAAYYGGWLDEILMRFTDIILAFPGLILCMTLVVVLVPTGLERLDAVMVALVIIGWPGYSRLIRGEILRVKSEDYVEAAKSVGCSDLRVIRKHILPNAIYPILIVFTLDLGTVVLAAAALSFLGLGASPGYADWGQIIARSLNWIYGPPSNPFLYWYTFAIPGIFISTFVLGWNLLGDALRDILDPTLRRK